MLWGSDGSDSSETNGCMKGAPVIYWWLVTQVILFYVIVAFGLATWGAYLCAAADAHEELTKQAVDDYLKEKKAVNRQFAIAAGQTTPLMIE